MSKKISPRKPSEVLAKRIEEVRARRGLTQKQLGELVGMGREAITNIESGVRQVKVDEWLALAAALNVAPIHLLVPLHDDAERLQVRSVGAADDAERRADHVREWIRGVIPFDVPKSSRGFFEFVSERPDSELEKMADDFLTKGVAPIDRIFWSEGFKEKHKERVGDVAWEIKEGVLQRETEATSTTKKEDDDG